MTDTENLLPLRKEIAEMKANVASIGIAIADLRSAVKILATKGGFDLDDFEILEEFQEPVKNLQVALVTALTDYWNIVAEIEGHAPLTPQDVHDNMEQLGKEVFGEDKMQEAADKHNEKILIETDEEDLTKDAAQELVNMIEQKRHEALARKAKENLVSAQKSDVERIKAEGEISDWEYDAKAMEAFAGHDPFAEDDEEAPVALPEPEFKSTRSKPKTVDASDFSLAVYGVDFKSIEFDDITAALNLVILYYKDRVRVAHKAGLLTSELAENLKLFFDALLSRVDDPRPFMEKLPEAGQVMSIIEKQMQETNGQAFPVVFDGEVYPEQIAEAILGSYYCSYARFQRKLSELSLPERLTMLGMA